MFDDGPLKIILLGSSAPGKSCLLNRFCNNSFSGSSFATIGVDFKTKIVKIDGVSVKLQIWDTAGAERFLAITMAYIRGSNGIIIVCDSTNEDSIKTTNYWVKQIEYRGMKDEAIIAVFGNKCELDRKVPKNYAKSIALENGLHYFEVSAKDGKGVEEAFYYVASLAYHLKLKKELEKEEEKKQSE